MSDRDPYKSKHVKRRVREHARWIVASWIKQNLSDGCVYDACESRGIEYLASAIGVEIRRMVDRIVPEASKGVGRG